MRGFNSTFGTIENIMVTFQYLPRFSCSQCTSHQVIQRDKHISISIQANHPLQSCYPYSPKTKIVSFRDQVRGVDGGMM